MGKEEREGLLLKLKELKKRKKRIDELCHHNTHCKTCLGCKTFDKVLLICQEIRKTKLLLIE